MTSSLRNMTGFVQVSQDCIFFVIDWPVFSLLVSDSTHHELPENTPYS